LLKKACSITALIAVLGFACVVAQAQGEKPDLTVEVIKFRSDQSAQLCQGKRNQFDIWIKNPTQVSIGHSFRVNVRFRVGGRPLPRTYMFTVESMGAGKKLLEIKDFDIRALGGFQMTVNLDTNGAVDEADETNNSETLSYDIERQCPYQLKVLVRKISVNPGSNSPGAIQGATVTAGTQSDPALYGSVSTNSSGIAYFSVVPGSVQVKASKTLCGSNTKTFVMSESAAETVVNLNCGAGALPH
jgi:hypothetical protein